MIQESFTRLVSLLEESRDLTPAQLAAKLEETYTMTERYRICAECGFRTDGHHPRCPDYDRSRRTTGDVHGYGRTG